MLDDKKYMCIDSLLNPDHHYDKYDFDKYETIKTICEYEYNKLDVSVNSLEDLIKLCDHPIVVNVEYNVDLKALHAIKDHLVELNNMIGMEGLKENVLDQIIYFIQRLHLHKTKKTTNEGDFLHTVIYGPPGTGKTEIAIILGKIFSKLGILKREKFRKVTRSDLVAGYLGQTALKTTDVILDCLGGVLFIDEAYALGNDEKKDTFSKECIDTLCEALSNYKSDLMGSMAGGGGGGKGGGGGEEG